MSVVAVGPLHALVPLLRLYTEGRDRAGFKPADADGLIRFLAITVGAVLDPKQRLVDLGDQLALAVAGAKLECPVGFERCPIGDIGLGEAFFLEMAQGLVRLPQQLALPAEQLLPEVFQLHRIHKRLFLGGMVVRRKQRFHAALDWMIQMRISAVIPPVGRAEYRHLEPGRKSVLT